MNREMSHINVLAGEIGIVLLQQRANIAPHAISSKNYATTACI
jgi:hypothetical protein